MKQKAVTVTASKYAPSHITKGLNDYLDKGWKVVSITKLSTEDHEEVALIILEISEEDEFIESV